MSEDATCAECGGNLVCCCAALPGTLRGCPKHHSGAGWSRICVPCAVPSERIGAPEPVMASIMALVATIQEYET